MLIPNSAKTVTEPLKLESITIFTASKPNDILPTHQTLASHLLQTHFPEGTWFCFSLTPDSQLHSVEMMSVRREDGPRVGKGTRGTTSHHQPL